MPVRDIILLRHGHRLAWTLDPFTGIYTSNYPYPTGLPADPPLADHGVRQSHETAACLSQLLSTPIKEDTLLIYSSPFYRCLETLRPSVEAFQGLGWDGKVRAETGVGEWFGSASFVQPAPGDWKFLKAFFPWVDVRESTITPDRQGESIDAFHARTAKALESIVKEVDIEYQEKGRGAENFSILICGHAAGLIASGRALTGQMPEDCGTEDFRCYTCGLSRFVRKQKEATTPGADKGGNLTSSGGFAGDWDCLLNSSCEHLSNGEERGWRFHGDESFDAFEPKQALKSDAELEGKPSTDATRVEGDASKL